MNLSIPIYIERHDDQLLFRPLFHAEPRITHRHMESGMNSLAAKLRRLLNELNLEHRHDQLAWYSYYPNFDDRMLKFRIMAGKKSAWVRLMFVRIPFHDRHLVYAPALEGLWFDLMPGENLEDRANEAVSEYVRETLRDESGDARFDPETELDRPKAWIMNLDIRLRPQIITRMKTDDSQLPFAMLGQSEKTDGRWELEKTGRCLNRQYPGGLDHAFLRENELKELEKALTDGRRRPIVLIGPPRSGKTAILHEYLRRAIERGKEGKYKKPRRYWLLSPQRLISGMSYVGQWEQRVLSIIKYVSGKRIVLVFDDFLGLFHAGVTSGSDLSVAHVLKPFATRRDVAILAEMTPEAFRALKERDRGFADLFHAIPVQETTPDDTLTILIRTMRELEGRYACQFHPGVAPLAVDLQRRYSRNSAFPGKAVVFMEHLASRFEQKAITPGDALDEFHQKSGLSLAILDDRVRLLKAEVETDLRQTVIGQQAAVTAMAEAVSIAKARLNDPSRPLASFLFLGPTGVGKTHCAKALARCLFGTEERLIRFDMNEYIEADAVARLAGTFHQPQGLLTNAVRHSPFGVILLDEIEKAHPDVFNLLLQVLDDGRLTDALGRTADFTNTIIIMTSNLGSQGADKSIGYMEDHKKARAAKYVRAAETFFRPEFFNRLDRITPFSHLTQSEIEIICEKAIQTIFRREGLIRRRCLLDIHPDIVAQTARNGYHPELGARALKREIERTIARPVSAYLAGVNPGKAVVITIDQPNHDIRVRAGELKEADKVYWPLLTMDQNQAMERIRRLEPFLEGAWADLEPFRPTSGVNTDNLAPEHEFYFEAADRLNRLRRRFQGFTDAQGRLTGPVRPMNKQMRFRGGKKRKLWKYGEPHISQKEVMAVQQLSEYLESVETAADPIALDQNGLTGMLLDAAELNALIAAGPRNYHQTACIRFRVLGDPAVGEHIRNMLSSLGERPWFNVASNESGVEIQGPLTYDLLKLEQGGHLFTGRHGGFSLVDLSIEPISGPEKAREEKPAKKNRPYPEIIRIYDGKGIVCDVRSGLTLKSEFLSAEAFYMLLAGRLQLPKELK